MEKDCVVIGAGLSGLAAAIRLAHFGKNVLICERHAKTGGLNSTYARNGIQLDTGLHAMTNFTPKNGPKSAPLLKLLRQLRIPYDKLELRPQKGSRIDFPEATLEFSNDFDLLVSEIKRAFPESLEGFLALDRFIMEYDGLDLSAAPRSARDAVAGFLSDPLLTDMLFAPLSYYGSAIPGDMELGQFSIMYRSVFREGFCRPADGMGSFLRLLEERFEECGGEIRRGNRAKPDGDAPALLLGNGVARILAENGAVTAVELDSGEIVQAKVILSSAGRHETMSLVDSAPEERLGDPGRLGFVETIAVLDDSLRDRVSDRAIVFFNRSEKFRYDVPAELVDYSSGVVCFPGGFQFEPGDSPPPPMVRITSLANYDTWAGLDKEAYVNAKCELTENALELAENVAGIVGLRDNAVFTDTFTPLTITRYTGKLNGAIYGAPVKSKDGTTPLEGLFLCGTDQGFLGITGAMLSGISMANAYALR